MKIKHISAQLLCPNWLLIIEHYDFTMIFGVQLAQRNLFTIHSDLLKILIILIFLFFNINIKFSRFANLKET